MKRNLLPYGSAFLNMDYALDPSGSIKYNIWPFYTTFIYNNLKHDPIKIDMSNF